MHIRILAGNNIKFPNLGIELKNVPTGFNLFGIDITLYGLMIAIGMVCGYLIAGRLAKKSGQDKELYLDFAIYAIIISVIGARLCYVIFEWDSFKDDLLSILNLRSGGLAIYGGIIGAILTGIVYCRIKKYSFFKMADTGMPGLLLGQIIGRWGNFFNREVFGKYTDNLLAMQLDLRDAGYDFNCSVQELAERYAGKPKALNMITEVRNNIQTIDGASYIQVHPAFLYESLWNLSLLIFLVIYWKHKKFNGEILLMYLAGYGLGRFWIEGIRTDQLFLWGTSIPVFQLLSAFMAAGSIMIIIIKRVRIKKKNRK